MYVAEAGYSNEGMWRAENDRIGMEHRPPISGEAVPVLEQSRRKRESIGDAWLFPSQRIRRRPTGPARRAREVVTASGEEGRPSEVGRLSVARIQAGVGDEPEEPTDSR